MAGETEGKTGNESGASGEKKGEAGQEKLSEKKSGLTHDEALSALKETRGEAAKNRVAAKENREELEKLKLGLAKALGIGGDDTSDLKKLTEQVGTLVSRLGTADKKDAFRLVAKSVGADADLAWAYLKDAGDLDDPDVNVKDALKKAMKEKPALKASQASATGDPGAGGTGPKPKDMNAFIRSAAGR